MSQFHYGSIKTIVKEVQKEDGSTGLNSTMVRLKQNRERFFQSTGTKSLNSTMVRLKRGILIIRYSGCKVSQFHYGSIKTY